MNTHCALALLTMLAAACAGAPPPASWPMGPGPRGDWTVDGRAPASLDWTKARWQSPLPETGQGGIAVAGGRVFVATMAPWTGEPLSDEEQERYAHAIEQREVVGKHIDGHCLDAATGELLWSRRVEGTVPSIYSYPFSDATSSSPVADAARVWFTNAGGRVACYTHDGELVWQRDFTPTFYGPFNKQFEPLLVDDPHRGDGSKTLIAMEPRVVGSDDMGGENPRWNFLVGLDAATGAELWTSEDALTHYNAPILVATDDGPCVLHARGGPHAVPERPVGMSLTRAAGRDAGRRVWRYEDPRGNHEASLQTMAADERYAYWLLKEPRNACVLVDVRTGEEVREISLLDDVVVDGVRQVKLDKGVFPARYSMHAADGRLFFQCYATAWGKDTIGPPYSFGCVAPSVEEGPAVRYVEVPTGFDEHGAPAWRTKRTARPLNSLHQLVTGDTRSSWDGWDWVFNGSPTQVGDELFFTLASGVVYRFDTSVRPFSADSFVSIDELGSNGCTWTANSLSFADGRVYHRTAAYLFCFDGADE